MAEPTRSQSFDDSANQQKPQSKYYSVFGCPLDNSQSLPTQSQPQRKYFSVSGSPLPGPLLQHSQTWSTSNSNTQCHINPYNVGHSPSVSHAEHHSLSNLPASVSHVAAPTSGENLPTGKLMVTVFKARNIKGDEFRNFGKADPYAVVKLGKENLGVKGETSVKPDAGSHPVWNQGLIFYVTRPDSAYNTLCITLYNKNRPLRNDNVLGQLTIVNLGYIIWAKKNRVLENWYPVFLEGKPWGEILLAFDLIPMSP